MTADGIRSDMAIAVKQASTTSRNRTATPSHNHTIINWKADRLKAHSPNPNYSFMTIKAIDIIEEGFAVPSV